MLKSKIELGFAVIVALILVLTCIVGFTQVANANPSQFVGTTQTATATTSVTYMTPGNATTTLVADTFNVSTGNNYTINVLELFVQLTASSTASQLNRNMEYSNGYGLNGNAVDCVVNPNGCDWYQDTFSNVVNFATSSLPNISSQVAQDQWKFSSTTSIVGQQVGTSTLTRDTRAYRVNAPARYVRAVFTCQGAGCGVWAQFVPVKETK